MPRRNLILASGEIYHVFNRSLGDEPIFQTVRNLNRTIEIVNYYRFPQRIKYSRFKLLPQNLREQYLLSLKNVAPLIEIYAFVFMPNHYHFLIKQLDVAGIVKFIGNYQNSFAKYYNIKNNRLGNLFESRFKAKRVETREEFIHISRYIHLNPATSFIINFDSLISYPWTSFGAYADEKKNTFVSTKTLINELKSRNNYVKFVANQVDYQRKLKLIKKLVFD